MVAKLKRHNELSLSTEVKFQLLRIDRSPTDRCLKPARFEEKRHGLATTKSGILLKFRGCALIKDTCLGRCLKMKRFF